MSLLGLAAASADTAQSFAAAMNDVAHAFEVLGALILVIGTIWSFILAVITLRGPGSAKGSRAYAVLRRSFGGALLLGLEVFVAADLIRTVGVAPTVENVLVLGLIVLIRTFLSFSLQTEMDGVPPWRRATATGIGPIKSASASALGGKTE
jgi:uncharacterized membrane protein